MIKKDTAPSDVLSQLESVTASNPTNPTQPTEDVNPGLSEQTFGTTTSANINPSASYLHTVDEKNMRPQVSQPSQHPQMLFPFPNPQHNGGSVGSVFNLQQNHGSNWIAQGNQFGTNPSFSYPDYQQMMMRAPWQHQQMGTTTTSQQSPYQHSNAFASNETTQGIFYAADGSQATPPTSSSSIFPNSAARLSNSSIDHGDNIERSVENTDVEVAPIEVQEEKDKKPSPEGKGK